MAGTREMKKPISGAKRANIARRHKGGRHLGNANQMAEGRKKSAAERLNLGN